MTDMSYIFRLYKDIYFLCLTWNIANSEAYIDPLRHLRDKFSDIPSIMWKNGKNNDMATTPHSISDIQYPFNFTVSGAPT